eukprot:EG_transcript_278
MCRGRRLFLLLCTAALPPAWGAALLPRGPGYALAVNHRTDTEFAYSYPRRLSRQFTVELWARGGAPTPNSRSLFSVAHPGNDNAFSLSRSVYVLGVAVADAPLCDPAVWCHLAAAVDLTAYPVYAVQTFQDGALQQNVTGSFSGGLPPSALEEEALSFVLGQEQDYQLRGWDPLQIFTGHVDDVRVWSTARTPAEIQANFQTVLAAPYPSALASYYTFDDGGWNAVYHEDQVNRSQSRRLYAADYATAATAPALPPAYAPPVAPLPRLALSTALLCPAPGAGAGLAVRAGPGGTVVVPVAALFCGGSAQNSAPVTVTVTGAQGGSVTAGGQNALLKPLSSQAAITFTAASAGGVGAGAGFNFTVSSGAQAVNGFVAVWPNTAPTLPGQLTLSGKEDNAVVSWVEAVDPDRDLISVELAAPPVAGAAGLDGQVNRSVQYSPPANANGAGVGVFALRVRDSWGAMSSFTMTVTVSLKPVLDAPALRMATTLSLYRGQRIAIPFEVVDVDGTDPFVIVSDWPAAAQGVLEVQDQGRAWVINVCSASSKVQWASGYGNWSSSYALAPDLPYGIANVVGRPTVTRFGDSTNAWCPATIDGGCVNRAPPSEAFNTFYTEFVEARFATPMYLTDVIVVENNGGDRTSRVLVPSDRNPSQWKAIMTQDIANSAAPLEEDIVKSLPVCQVVWPVDRVRLEFDTCHRAGWYELDAIQIRGGVVAPANVLNTTARLYFRAAPRHTGPVSFGLTATSCLGSFRATSDPLSVTLEVKDTPHTLTVEATDGWASIDVGQLDSGPREGSLLVLDLPANGALRYNGRMVAVPNEDLGSTITAFDYRPTRCDAQGKDSFLVQLGPTAVVQVNVRGCTTLTAQLIPIVVPSVVVPVALCLLWYVWRRLYRHNRRDNSRAPKDAARDLCVMFTDIQASTALWAEVPEMMAAALDVHHTIIRRLIAKYKCYEVKTIGDSFMVACAAPLAAVQLALAIQEALYSHSWQADSIDVFYRRQTACKLPADGYARLWNGLRVRVGLHYGRAQIHFDETTKGYDYYGTVVNAAARIEGAAHGGQVVLSQGAFDRVQAYCEANAVAVRPLGGVQLRGLPAPVDLVQVLPAAFAEREFPPLRLDHGGHDLLDIEERLSSNRASSAAGSYSLGAVYPQALDREVLAHPAVCSGALTADAAGTLAHHLYYALKALLNMHRTPEERARRLRELCRQWHVGFSSVSDRQEGATIGKLALQLMGSVVSQMGTARLRTQSVASRLSSTPSTATSLSSSAHSRRLSSMCRQALNRILPTPPHHNSLVHPSFRTVPLRKQSLTIDDAPESYPESSIGELSIPIPVLSARCGYTESLQSRELSFLS